MILKNVRCWMMANLSIISQSYASNLTMQQVIQVFQNFKTSTLKNLNKISKHTTIIKSFSKFKQASNHAQ